MPCVGTRDLIDAVGPHKLSEQPLHIFTCQVISASHMMNILAFKHQESTGPWVRMTETILRLTWLEYVKAHSILAEHPEDSGGVRFAFVNHQTLPTLIHTNFTLGMISQGTSDTLENIRENFLKRFDHGETSKIKF